MFTYLFSISVFKHHFALSHYMLLISGSLLQHLLFCPPPIIPIGHGRWLPLPQPYSAIDFFLLKWVFSSHSHQMLVTVGRSPTVTIFDYNIKRLEVIVIVIWCNINWNLINWIEFVSVLPMFNFWTNFFELCHHSCSVRDVFQFARLQRDFSEYIKLPSKSPCHHSTKLLPACIAA